MEIFLRKPIFPPITHNVMGFQKGNFMKKYLKYTHTNRSKICGGIRVKNGNVNFNWKSDNYAEDLINLYHNNSGEFNKDDIMYIYGYQFNDNGTYDEKKIVRDYLKKDGIYTDDVETFVERGVHHIEDYINLKNFGAVVNVESTSGYSLVDIIGSYLNAYIEGIHVSFQLIKDSYKNVQFDINKAKLALKSAGYTESEISKELSRTVDKFNALKQSNELFQMKKFMPAPIRSGFYDFLKFRTDDEKFTYMNLQGENVIIYDDFYTSGATVSEIIRYLKAINDKNTLTVFVLVKQ